MAVNFGLLQQAAPVSAFFQGRQDVQAEADRNMLRQQQAEQLAMQRENALALREQRMASAAELKAKTERAAQRQQFLTNLSAKMAEGGHKLDRPTLGQVLQFGMQTGEDSLIKLATEGLRALDEEDIYQRETARLGQPGAEGYTRPQVQQMIASPSTRLQAQGKALAPTLAKEPTPRAPQLLTPEEEAQRIRIARESRPPREPKEPVDPMKVAFRETDAAGNVTFFNAYGDPIRSQAGAAKPSATFEKTTAQRKQLSLDIDRTIVELENAAKPKGLIEQSTGSGAGRLVDITAAFVGQATPGAIAAGKLAPIADMVLKMVPRFEGPQSDKDTKSYKEAAGQLADTSLPTKIRQAAATEIVRLMKARKGQFATQDMAAEGAAPTPAAPTPAAPAPAGGNFPAPPPAAIDALKRGQGTDAQFDAIFGPGAAARARGR